MIEYSVQTVKTDRFEMDYLKFGTGARPLVLLPAQPGNKDNGSIGRKANHY